MDTSLIIVSTIVILAVFGPILIISRSGNSDREKLIKKFQAVAAENNLIISDYETWGEKIIGIDNNAKKVLYLRDNTEGFKVEVFSLSELEKCEPVLNYKLIKTKSGKEKVLEAAFLSLVSKNRASTGLQLCFYDQDTTVMPNFEEKRLQKWSETIRKAA